MNDWYPLMNRQEPICLDDVQDSKSNMVISTSMKVICLPFKILMLDVFAQPLARDTGLHAEC